MSRDMRFPTMWYVRPAKPQTSLRIRAVWSEPLLVAWILPECKATHWTSFGVQGLKGGCTGSSESTLVKISHCLKSHGAAHMQNGSNWFIILTSLFSTLIAFILIYCLLVYTYCQCVRFERIPNQVWSFIHQLIKT